MKQSITLGAVFCMILIASIFLLFSQQTNFVDRTENAIFTLQVQYDLELDLLKKDIDSYTKLSMERNVIQESLREMYGEMESLIKRENPTVLSLIEEKEAEIIDAEKKRIANMEENQRCLDRIKERFSKLNLLDQKIASLKDTLPREEETVTGKWDVTLLPGGDKGIFMLKQSGAIITGQYQLEGGWKGSIEGTLIDRKVLLKKIDSKLGRSGEFEGFLSYDGKTIRGTWMDYEVSGGRASSGSWAATRREG